MRSNYSVLSGSFVFNRHVGLSSLNTSFLRFITILNFALLRYCSSAPVLQCSSAPVFYLKTLFLILLYRKGTEVEVLEKGNEPFESWRPAKIVSGNGHTYVVVYESCSASPMNKVPRKALRPRPPLQTKCWAFADIAEVFDDDGSWKLAEVMGTHGSNNIVARLLNSSKEIVVVAPLFQLRVPHTWMDDHWVPFQKEFMNRKNIDVKNQPKRQVLMRQRPLFSAVEKKGKLEDQFYPNSLGGIRKRQLVYANDGGFGKRQKFEMNWNSENDITSSVGSCSVLDGLPRSSHQKTSRKRQRYALEDDAESFCDSPTGHHHRLELEAYRSTLRSLYAAGTLSWEQESSLAELRSSLNITNDEHLAEVKDLLSTRR